MMTTTTFSASFYDANRMNRHRQVKRASRLWTPLTFSMSGFTQCRVSWMYWFSSGWQDIWRQARQKKKNRRTASGFPNRQLSDRCYAFLQKPLPAQARCISSSSERFQRDRLHARTGWGESQPPGTRTECQRPLEERDNLNQSPHALLRGEIATGMNQTAIKRCSMMQHESNQCSGVD